ncbi:hypothetical protein MHU86_20812 [Fragilaria crotonensis]|nr:hypothetical protein MHU86_20812 [Fragilaria crotonensis]
MDTEDDDNRSTLGAASTLGDDDDDYESPQRDCIGSLVGRPARALQNQASLSQWSTPLSGILLGSIFYCNLRSSQCLSNSISASDASYAPSTTADSMVGSSRARKRRHDATYESSLLPLVQSIKELAECQRQLVFDRGEERRHEPELDQIRDSSRTKELCRDQVFRRRAELVLDLARKYRKPNAELDPTDENRLSEFYIWEGPHLHEEEIRASYSAVVFIVLMND